MDMGHARNILMGALLLLVLPLVVSMETCRVTGMPGIPGIPGLSGRDGRNGLKGDTGEPGFTTGQGSQQGVPGEEGKSGPTGKRGAVGVRGERGQSGLPGEAGEAGEDDGPTVAEVHSAFSVSRAVSTAPPGGSAIIFSTVITNYNDDYNTQTGHFRCSVPGTYYFVYHASATEKLCVVLKLDGIQVGAWCDVQTRNSIRQVSSGGLAVYLKKGQEVWLEASDFRAMTSIPEGISLFSGFLMHQHE